MRAIVWGLWCIATTLPVSTGRPHRILISRRTNWPSRRASSIRRLQELEKRQSPTAVPASSSSSAAQPSATTIASPSTKSSVDPRAAAASLPPLSSGGRSLSFEQQKALKAQTAKLERQIKAIEDKLEDLQAQIDELEARMSTPEGSQDQQLYIRHAALKSEMDDVSFEWLEASEKLEKLQD